MVSTEAVARSDMSDMGLGRTPPPEQSSHSAMHPYVYILPVQALLLYHSFSLSVGSLHISLACETKGCGVTCQRVCHIPMEQIQRWKELQPPSCWGEQGFPAIAWYETGIISLWKRNCTESYFLPMWLCLKFVQINFFNVCNLCL